MGGSSSAPVSFGKTDGTDWLYPNGKPTPVAANPNPGMPRATQGYDVRQMLKDQINALRGRSVSNPLAYQGLYSPARQSAVAPVTVAPKPLSMDDQFRLTRLETKTPYFKYNDQWYDTSTGKPYNLPAGTPSHMEIKYMNMLNAPKTDI
jgi:hypothetical protein